MEPPMKIFRPLLSVLLAASLCFGQVESITIPEGTQIRVRLEQDLSGDTAREGQTVQLSVVDDVKIGDVVVVAKGANVTGKIVLAQAKRSMGRTGKLDFSVERVTAADQSSIPLRYTSNKMEGGSQAVSTGIITAGVAIVFFPVAPLVLLRRGKEAKIAKGTTFDVFTDQRHVFAAEVSVKTAKVDIASNPSGADVKIGGDFVGNTPLAVDLPDGEHEIVVEKKGFRTWERKLKTSGASIGLNAELEAEPLGNPVVPAIPVTVASAQPAPTAPAEDSKDSIIFVPNETDSAPSKSASGKPLETRNPPAPSPDDTATVKFEDESYAVYIGVIGKDEAGKTSVELLGDKIGGRISIRNGGVLVPIGMKIVVNGQTTFGFENVNMSAGRYIFQFDTTSAPEKIIVYGNDGTDTSSVTFDGKTKKPESGAPVASKSAAPAKSAPTPPAKPYDARKGAHDIVDLIDNKIVEVEIKGDNITSVNMRVRRLVNYPVTVLVPVGSFFVSANSSAQNMVATAESRTMLSTGDWRTISVSAACANRPRDIPDGGDHFTVLRSPQQKELAALMPVLNKAGTDTPTKQAAVWIITDNADYDDLGILVSFPGNARVIGSTAAARAMKICADAGIDITEKSIWSDRQTILEGLSAGTLKTWLQNFGAAAAKSN
jgi:hypothetical protein